MIYYLIFFIFLITMGILLQWLKSPILIGPYSFPVFNKNTQKHILNFLWFFTFMVVFLFGALRYQTFGDFSAYYDEFTSIATIPGYTSYMEKGYYYLNVIVAKFTNNPQWIIAVTVFITSFLFLARIKTSSAYLPFSMFMFFFIYKFCFTYVRQGIAMSLTFFAIDYAKKKQWGKVIILIIIASFFHKVALIMLPLLILMRIKYTPVIYGFAFMVSFVIFVFSDKLKYIITELFYPEYLTVLGGFFMTGSNYASWFVITSGIYMVLCFLYGKQMLEKNKSNILYINFSVLILLLHLFFFWIPLWGRLLVFFNCVLLLLIPEAISCEKDSKVRLIYYLIIGAIFAYFSIRGIMGSSALPGMIKSDPWFYSTIFFK